MDISKIKEICDKLRDDKPLPLKYGELKPKFIRELAKKHNIPLVDAADFGNIEPVVIDENAKKVHFRCVWKQNLRTGYCRICNDSAWFLEHSNDCCPNAVSFKHFFWNWNEHNCYRLFWFHYSS